jgi:hypothetical protein
MQDVRISSISTTVNIHIPEEYKLSEKDVRTILLGERIQTQAKACCAKIVMFRCTNAPIEDLDNVAKLLDLSKGEIQFNDILVTLSQAESKSNENLKDVRPFGGVVVTFIKDYIIEREEERRLKELKGRLRTPITN